MSGERTNVPDDRRIMFDDDRVTLDERLAAAAIRNKQTSDCNGRPDCRAAHHLPICESLR